MSDTSDLKRGTAIRLETKVFFVADSFFVSPGKGAAFFRTKLREIPSGKVIEKTFKSGEPIQLVDTERRSATFLYKSQDIFYFMDEENFEQYEIESAMIVQNIQNFLKENLPVVILFVEGNIVDVSFVKTKIVYKVIAAEPAVKGDSVSNVYRPVTIETGAEVQVPLFISEGESIIINVDTGEYSGRSKT